MNTARRLVGSAATSNSSAACFGGSPDTAITELWDGVTWTEVADLSEARSSLKGAGTGTSMIACSGDPLGIQNVEEFTQPQNVEIITD